MQHTHGPLFLSHEILRTHRTSFPIPFDAVVSPARFMLAVVVPISAAEQCLTSLSNSIYIEIGNQMSAL